MASQLRILASTSNDAVLIRAIGVCSMGACPTLKEFVQQFRKPVKTDIYFDLSDAMSIDSTFTGFLLSLAMKKSDPLTPNLHLVAPAPRVMSAIDSMHVAKLFDFREAMPAPTGEWLEVIAENAGCETLGRTVLDAHQQLIEADPRNAAEFGRVVEGIRADGDRRAKDSKPKN